MRVRIFATGCLLAGAVLMAAAPGSSTPPGTPSGGSRPDEAAAAGPRADGPPLAGARLESRSLAARSLDAVVVGLRGDVAYVAWSVAKQPGQGDVCCYEGRRRGCDLDAGRRGVTVSNDGPGGEPEGTSLMRFSDDRLVVYVGVRDGAIETVSALAANCPVDAAGSRVVWLEDVRPDESARFLRGVAAGGSGGRSGRRGPPSQALAALALQAGDAAEAGVEALARDGERTVRHDAIFWLGEARAASGLQALVRLRSGHPDAATLEQVAFALSQSREPGAATELVDMARRDASSAARAKALFWLGQKGGPVAEQEIVRAVREDRDGEVRKQGVFALAQLPDRRGTELLLSLLRTAPDHEVRKQALFWLGQSDDPRAQDALEAILLR